MAFKDDTTPSEDACTAEADGCAGWTTVESKGDPTVARCPRVFNVTGTPLLIEPPAAEDWGRLATIFESSDATTMGLPLATPCGIETWLATLREQG
jgi:hypothetical protein